MTLRKRLLSFTLFCAGLLVCAPLTGCGDTCIVITGIFPAAMSISNTPGCKLGNANGTVNLRISSSPVTSAGPMAPNLQHIFVSVSGIEAHPSAIADVDSPDWEELAPELVTHPIQIDLMEPAVAGANSCAPSLIRGTVVRADVYRQIRLSLVSDQPAADDAVPEHNACRDVGFNCALATNGQPRALTIENGVQKLHIAPDRIANGFFRVVPDAETQLSIEFNPYSSLASPSGEAIRVIPVLTAESAPTCDSLPPSQ